ncbi:MAG TPA: cold shock domain-containing protein [Amycolatopsis sp.]|nr:cold shock domain-containing protein [Amycolatopsis sp.]
MIDRPWRGAGNETPDASPARTELSSVMVSVVARKAWIRLDEVAVMTTGKVVRYDEFRGYGFASPVHGGEDVFIHVNDFEFDSNRISVGTLVEFTTAQSDRGPKASHIRLIERPLQTPVAAQAQPVPETASTDDALCDVLCDVLSAQEFRAEVTEVLLTATPPLNSEQILNIRESLMNLANSHDWIEA